MKTEEKINSSYIIITIIAGILTMVPISSLILNLIDTNGILNENIYIVSFYLLKIIGIALYFILLKNITNFKKITAFISVITMIISIFMYIAMTNMENTGLDYIGEALVYAMGFNIFIIVYYISSFLLFISYAKKFILKKASIITILSIILLIGIILLFNHLTSYTKISEDIPTVNDFKTELINRNIYVDDNLLFGINNEGDNIYHLDFNKDSNDKYPSYVYYGYKSENTTDNKYIYQDYIEWLIYYTNGEIYAVVGELDDSQLFQNFYKLETSYMGNILTENTTAYTYNIEENRYDIINIKKQGASTNTLRTKFIDGNDIIVDTFEKFPSLVIDKYELVDKIDAQTLNSYVYSLGN